MPSAERDVPLRGYAAPLRLWCLLAGAAAVVSYSPILEPMVPSILAALTGGTDPDAAATRLRSVFPSFEHALKLVFHELPEGAGPEGAIRLGPEHYGDFLRFFAGQHPDASPEGWLEDYYRSLAARGYAFGVFVDGRLVAATDAPDMPFMQDIVVEIGINTLAPYRRRGYARLAVRALLERLLAEGKVPVWSCRSDNLPSERLGLSAGFRRFGDVLFVRG